MGETPKAHLASSPALTATNPAQADLQVVALQRQLFWENVVREMLTGLSVMRHSQPELFDGRIAILTRGGERLPIAEVIPMFACGIPGTPAERAASIAVECTVFRIRTPGGEVFTFPLTEIRGLHSLTPELMQQLEQEAAERAGDHEGAGDRPFGFAAFRSLTPPQDVVQIETAAI